jgi:hypothetical protein
MPTKEQALDTYKRSIQNEAEHEWPVWVKEVYNALQKGTELTPNIWAGFVHEVFAELKREMGKTTSMADEKDRP